MSALVFAVPFGWDSAIGRAVEVVVDAVRAPGDVIEIAAGRGAAAERFRHRGFDYAAVVADDADRAELDRRGFAARRADLADPDAVVAALDELAVDPPSAVIAVDVLDRLPGATLAAVRDWLVDRPSVLLVMSTAPSAAATVVAPPGSAADLAELVRVHRERADRLDDLLVRHEALERRLQRGPVRLASRAVGLVDRIRSRTSR